MATYSTSDNSENAPSKTSGQYALPCRSVVEAAGNLSGAQSWQQSGKEEHAVRLYFVLAFADCRLNADTCPIRLVKLRSLLAKLRGTQRALLIA